MSCDMESGQISLVDRKKQQWQKERDEMARLLSQANKIYRSAAAAAAVAAATTSSCGNIDVTKGTPATTKESTTMRNSSTYEKFGSKEEQSGNYFQEKGRRSSLPPIEKYPYDLRSEEESTSGYTSERAQYSSGNSSGGEPDQLSELPGVKSLSYGTDSSASSFVSFDQDKNSLRSKWSTLQDHTEFIAKTIKAVPEWLEKGLTKPGRESDGGSEHSFSYIRGQNAPIDPNILAERESRRKKALELQNAIKEQLEERDRIKRAEREKRLLEERLEEARILREIEEEQQKLEFEQRIHREKIENEKRKEELMRRAIEKAALDAQKEKEKGRKREKTSWSEKEPETISYSSDFEELPEAPEANPKVQPVEVKEPVTELKREEKSYEKYTREKDPKPAQKVTEPEPTKSDMDSVTLVYKGSVPVLPLPVVTPQLAFNPNSFNNIQFYMVGTANPVLTPYPQFAVHQTYPLAQPVTQNDLSSHFSEQKPQEKAPEPARSATLRRFSSDFVPTETEVPKDEPEEPKSEPKSESPKENSTSTLPTQFVEKLCDHCNCIHICSLNRDTESPKKADNPPQLPHDGTFTKEKPEVAIVNANPPLDEAKDPLQSTKLLIECATQTENDCYFCVHHQQHLCLPDVCAVTTSSTLIDETTAEKKEKEFEPKFTTTTTIIKREKKSIEKQRPAWGVNRPATQYVKASDRDPFRRKSRNKAGEARDALETATVATMAPRTIRPNTIARDQDLLRNVCHELLPIKTDANGKVYFVKEKSFIINEALKRRDDIAKERILLASRRSIVGELVGASD